MTSVPKVTFAEAGAPPDDANVSVKALGDKSLEGISDRSISSINAQLITHGWIKRPLNLDRLPEKDHLAITTVLFDLLGASIVSRYTDSHRSA